MDSLKKKHSDLLILKRMRALIDAEIAVHEESEKAKRTMGEGFKPWKKKYIQPEGIRGNTVMGKTEKYGNDIDDEGKNS